MIIDGYVPHRDGSHSRCPRCDSRLIERRVCNPPGCEPHAHWRCIDDDCGWTSIENVSEDEEKGS